MAELQSSPSHINSVSDLYEKAQGVYVPAQGFVVGYLV